jgi:hypothetical protein
VWVTGAGNLIFAETSADIINLTRMAHHPTLQDQPIGSYIMIKGPLGVMEQSMHSHTIEDFRHPHIFLGDAHERNERKTWAVISICAAMMLAEIVGGLWFGSVALIADGFHMLTHAGALLIAALAYTYSRRYARDERLAFGTGKLGDLAARFVRRISEWRQPQAARELWKVDAVVDTTRDHLRSAHPVPVTRQRDLVHVRDPAIVFD